MINVIDNRLDRRRALIIGAFTAAHFLLTAATLFLAGAMNMSRFDTGEPAGLPLIMVRGAFQVLTLPLVAPSCC